MFQAISFAKLFLKPLHTLHLNHTYISSSHFTQGSFTPPSPFPKVDPLIPFKWSNPINPTRRAEPKNPLLVPPAAAHGAGTYQILTGTPALRFRLLTPTHHPAFSKPVVGQHFPRGYPPTPHKAMRRPHATTCSLPSSVGQDPFPAHGPCELQGFELSGYCIRKELGPVLQYVRKSSVTTAFIVSVRTRSINPEFQKGKKQCT